MRFVKARLEFKASKEFYIAASQDLDLPDMLAYVNKAFTRIDEDKNIPRLLISLVKQ